MQLTIIIWTLICATIIIAYPIFLYNRSSSIRYSKKDDKRLMLEHIKLFTFDLRDRPLGWSCTLEIPELTQDVLYDTTVLFYLETEETCLKLPVNNETLGYTANVFKNIGKVYLTFKCIKDGVSNYNAPMCHLKSLKMLIVKSDNFHLKSNSIYSQKKYPLHYILKTKGINIHDYEETLEYLSNFCEIDFKGYHRNRISPLPKNQPVLDTSSELGTSKENPKYSALII
ncbi:hypothetical protein ACOKFD_15360 [Flagellimonas sp. S174]|uniref:hypothetical protein n=1 Tax=Flagellimonas sp. S174 TaxID=3410790 RepID=UPI003BF4FB7D